MSKQHMTKDLVPDDFTLGLALVDAIPVIFFGIDMLIIGRLLGSGLFAFGAVLCLVGGAGKVLWKIIVALQKKNIWFLFVQMRILMPIGFLLMIAALIASRSTISFAGIWKGFTSFPSVLFFAAGILGMVLMSVFAVKLDNSDLRSNWIEQITNGIAQTAFCIGLLLLQKNM